MWDWASGEEAISGEAISPGGESDTIRAACTRLRHAVEEGRPVVLATGAGAAADAICDLLLAGAGPSWRVVRVQGPVEGPLALQQQLASILMPDHAGSSGPADLAAALNRHSRPGQTSVLAVERAHTLDVRGLQYLWLLRLLSAASAAPMQLVLIGDRAIGRTLADPALADLRAAIALRVDLPDDLPPPGASRPDPAAAEDFFAMAASWTALQGFKPPSARRGPGWFGALLGKSIWPAGIGAALLAVWACVAVVTGPPAPPPTAPHVRTAPPDVIAGAPVLAETVPAETGPAATVPAKTARAETSPADPGRPARPAPRTAQLDIPPPPPAREAAPQAGAIVVTRMTRPEIAPRPAAVLASYGTTPPRLVLAIGANTSAITSRAALVMEALRQAGLPAPTLVAGRPRQDARLRVGYFFPQDRVHAETVVRALATCGPSAPAQLLPLPKITPAPGTVQVFVASS